MNKLAKITGIAMLSVGLLAGCQNKEEKAKADEPKKEVIKLTEEEKFEKELVGEWIAPETSFIYEFRKDGKVAVESAISSKKIYDYEVVGFDDEFAEIEMTQGYNVKTDYWKLEKKGVMIKSPFAGSSTEIDLYKTE
ncbi:hypothetical protein [Mammaliicoccus sp. M-M49]|uniref:hypothetical protein n=1 Tax=Mammaliicoccus TaxID=2803850 RepID=UPI000FEEBCDE|nr:hypothetical protein [Mammaliicoccus sp. M-M49]RIO71706.1 hypothetical protein BUZ85_12710 [Mammaliicoccus sciuri]